MTSSEPQDCKIDQSMTQDLPILQEAIELARAIIDWDSCEEIILEYWSEASF